MHVSIIEDEKILAKRVKDRLEKDGFYVTVFFSFKEFMSNPNLISELYIIDLSLGDGSGFDIIKYLRNDKKLNSPIIITSAYNDENKKIYGLDLGADDYLPKVFSTEELLARIRAIIRRKSNTTNNSILKYKNIQLDLKSRKITVGGKYIHLTNQETKLIHFFISNKGKMLSKLELINSVWGDYELVGVSDNTINATISKLRKKLGNSFNLVTKINEGYILEN